MVLAIGFCILPAMVIGAIMFEREKNLKHMQMISGMNITAYWIVNIIFDIFKLELTMFVCVGLLFLFELKDYYNAFPIFLLYPFGIVPITHATSFLFTTEWAAQFFTVFGNLVIMIVIPLSVLVMSLIENTAEVARTINYYARAIPAYNIPHALLFCGTGK